ncbi:hypothetical protein LCGC14_1129870 [marine sediment metagenome]|uniref:Uncharacterized protein n=1 Tax=marine sediment metagenome TaxID=412755 RepID=A0A0F9Q748_9ZZZZ
MSDKRTLVRRFVYSYTDGGLECEECDWRGTEDSANTRDLPDETVYACPRCSELCAYTPIDELIDADSAERICQALMDIERRT